MSHDLYIIAAGKGSRMGGAIPKALVNITDKPCLTTTLQQIGHKFTNVFIVTNKEVDEAWMDYYVDLKKRYPELYKNVVNLSIHSGLGDGHAVMKGLDAAEGLNQYYSSRGLPLMHVQENVIIAWGDVFFPQAEIIDELLEYQNTRYSGVLPCTYESHPYVQLVSDVHRRCTHALFSKYGEVPGDGFHDQSVFLFKRSLIHATLKSLHAAMWKGNKYVTHNGELSLLYAFHYLYNMNDPAIVYETKYPTLSFNTPEEVAAIQREIDLKWREKFRR
jgi:NDP-sugar pyrophosphorylase family protein